MNSDMREDLINALTDSELEEIMEEMYLDDTVDVLEEMPATCRQTADGDRCGKNVSRSISFFSIRRTVPEV